MKRKICLVSVVAIVIAVLIFLLSYFMITEGKNEIPITNFHSFSESEMNEKKHIKLISKLSNQIEYLNEDGTKTLYMYSSNIPNTSKEDEKIVPDITQDVSSESHFIKKFNEISVSYPKKAEKENSIIISEFETQMRVSGLVSGNAYESEMENIYGDSSKMIVYNKEKLYSTKQGFFIERELATGKENEINFKVEMENCYTDISCPEYILFRENETDNVKGIVYAPVGLCEGDLFFGKLEITSQSRETNEYFLMSSIKNSKKTSAKTSQSFALYVSKQPDSAVYKNIPIINSYLSQYNRLGGETEEGETYIRIEDLDKLTINSSKIKSAKLYIHSLNGNTDDLCIEPAIDDWCSFTLKWETKPRSDSSMQVKSRKQTNGDVVFDITPIVRKWIDNRGKDAEYTIRKGMVLKSKPTGKSALIASNDNGLYGSVLVLEIKDKE